MQKEQNKSKSSIKLTELELFRILFKDLFPIIKNNKNNNPNIKKFNDVSIDDIIKIEEAISKKSFSNNKIAKKFDFKKSNFFEDNFFFYNAEIKNALPSNACPYSISISYENNGWEEKLDIEIRNNKNNNYKISIIKQKNLPDMQVSLSHSLTNRANFFENNYSIKINYEYRNNEEKLNVSYGYNIGYLQKHIEGKNDFTERVPLKWLNILPETMMGGVLGFTYIGDPSMGRRADLTGQTARMVDIHESIHTPDEYETVCLTRWIMSKEKSRYIK